MTAVIFAEAEDDLESAFNYYQNQRSGLGNEMIDEFRRGVDQILQFPEAWQPLDAVYRRYRLHRFPYGIVYRIATDGSSMVIVAVMHLHRKPDVWRERNSSGP